MFFCFKQSFLHIFFQFFPHSGFIEHSRFRKCRKILVYFFSDFTDEFVRYNLEPTEKT